MNITATKPLSQTKRYWTFDKASSAALLENSYTRLPLILRLRREMESANWWRLLGEYWSCCDNIGLYADRVRGLLNKAKRKDLDLMMDADDRTGFNGLPHVITVYRGCYENNRNGLSWSLSPEIAERFPRLVRYRQTGTPILITGKVNRADAVFKNGREEREIISAKVQMIGSLPMVERTHE